MGTEEQMQMMNLVPQPLSYEEVLRDPLNLQVLTTIEAYAAELRKRGIKVQTHSYQSVILLGSLPIEKKVEIHESHLSLVEWLQDNESVIITEEDLYKSFLKRALDHFGYWIHDDFWKILDKDHVLEFYGENMTQLYRSVNFFQYSSYSILDLCIVEWYLLWERSKLVMQEIHKGVSHVYEVMTPAAQFVVPTHLLREVYRTGNTEPFIPTAMLLEFKYIGSLMKGVDPTPKGCIVTCKAEVVAEGTEALDIQVI